MQSEGGAAGALHGALQSGALTTTFTASQGLLLMIPNMYKIAGELTPAVLHVAARSLAAQGLSIFGDHSDVMAVRQTGFALLASASVQEAHDLALVAQAATLATRVPFVHFFDGFRTSHELNTIEMLSDDDLRALVPVELVRAHRDRALSPERPFIRGTAQNPDVYFQGRETVNPFYARVPDAVTEAMDQLAARTGRQYAIVEYSGDPDAERVLVLMGSGAQTARETVAHLSGGRRAGRRAAGAAVPAVPDRRAAGRAAGQRSPRSPCWTAPRSPVRWASRCSWTCWPPSPRRTLPATGRSLPTVIGGRYGLGSKEFTPGMVAGVFAELARDRPRSRFTIGITDDVDRHQPALRPRPGHRAAADRARGLLRPRLGRHGRREQEHHQDPRRRPAAARPGLLRVRLEEVRLADRVAPAVRAGPDPGAVPGRAGRLRRLSPLRAAGPRRRAATGPRPARPCCSTARIRRQRSGTRCPARCRSRSSPRPSTSTPSTPTGSPARPASPGAPTPCCRPASSPSPGCCPATRRSPRSRPRSPRRTAGAAPTWSRATTPRSTRRCPRCTASRYPAG